MIKWIVAVDYYNGIALEYCDHFILMFKNPRTALQWHIAGGNGGGGLFRETSRGNCGESCHVGVLLAIKFRS